MDAGGAAVPQAGLSGQATLSDLNGLESSKTSPFRSLSLHSDDSGVLEDASHFEDIGLDEDGMGPAQKPREAANRPAAPSRRPSMPFGRSVSSEHANPYDARSPLPPPTTRDLAGAGKNRSNPGVGLGLRQNTRSRPSLPPLGIDSRGYVSRSSSLNSRSADSQSSSSRPRPLASRSASSLHAPRRRHRSPSPNLSLTPRDPNTLMKPRSPSRHSSRERKTPEELERECDDAEDDDEEDHIPDGYILDNVPLSPRPNGDRTLSRPSSRAASAERPPKERERVRSVGSGTPAVAVAQGSLRSPTWKTDASGGAPPTSSTSPGPSPDRGAPSSPFKARAKSWNAGWSDLSAEARALTEKLEEHAGDDVDGSYFGRGRKPDHRVRSALPDLPSLRHANMMMDAMPVSKEKEAVLGRTRPSWLPPKDPAEDKKHWKEYEKMMARSAESERRREADKLAKSNDRDTTADGLMRIWEDSIIPRWPDAVRERRTRELWWRGVASRSRGVVWPRAIGNELGLTEKSYKAALNRAREVEARVKAGKGDTEDVQKGVWLSKIYDDVNGKTWQDLRIFQIGGPLHQSLLDVISAYVMYRSDVGYVDGCNTVAALLLLNLATPASAFIALANVLNRPLSLGFYAADPGTKASAYNLVMQTLQIKSPGLHEHLTRGIPGVEPESYLSSVFTGLGTLHLAMEECTRLWDVYVFEGDSVMVRAATALLLRQEMALLGTHDPEEVARILGRGGTRDGRLALAGGDGDEEKWMTWLREAGKA